MRIVVATVAFRIGLEVRTVVRWGHPEDLEMDMLETVCGGRDNVLSDAIL